MQNCYEVRRSLPHHVSLENFTAFSIIYFGNSLEIGVVVNVVLKIRICWFEHVERKSGGDRVIRSIILKMN